MMNWFKRSAHDKLERETGGVRPDLSAELKLERLRRAVLDFPGRGEADLARIIYGRSEQMLVADDARRLEATGMVTRDPEGGGLYATRG